MNIMDKISYTKWRYYKMYYTLKRVSIHIAHIITTTVHNSKQRLPIHTARYE